MSYAENTRVPVERSRAEIERTLIRYGVEGFFYGRSSKNSGIGFTYKGRMIRLSIPMPQRKDYGSTKAGEETCNREHRRLWRVLLLSLKAKLELVDSGLVSFEDEFLAYTCLPDGQTVSQMLQPQLENMVETGRMPKLLPEGMGGAK